jgi:predicted membrane-bound dolichyl-phosphate-mannose-protein mannosyltransferase
MNKLLEVIKHPLDSERFHQLLTKRQWFILFNIVAIVGLLLTKRLNWSLQSIVTSALALLVVNFVAAISARRYPDWK